MWQTHFSIPAVVCKQQIIWSRFENPKRVFFPLSDKEILFEVSTVLAVEKEMATHSSILAWEIPWTEEPGRLRLLGSQKSQTQHSY